MVVSFKNFGVFTSTGATWVRGMIDGEPLISTSSSPPHIATNADGTVLVAATDRGSEPSPLLISNDKGGYLLKVRQAVDLLQLIHLGPEFSRTFRIINPYFIIQTTTVTGYLNPF